MADLAQRIVEKITDAEDSNGAVMKRWDMIRSSIAAGDRSDGPRLMFEDEIESFVELLKEALVKIPASTK